MQPDNLHDPGQDPDRTMLVPPPGARRPRGATGQPSLAPDLPGEPFAPAAQAPIAAGIPALPGCGLNPLVRAATALLGLVVPLRGVAAAPDLEVLRERLSDAVRRFEAQARDAGIEPDTIAAARYALCTLIDETVSGTPWGAAVWNRRSLLVAFHNEAWGGEKFFLVLQRLSADPGRHLHVLELMYLCLALGLEGRYRVMERGHEQLAALRERLLAIVARQRGATEQDLSPRWRGQATAQSRVSGRGPWLMAAGAAGLLLLAQLAGGWLLGRESDAVYARLAALRAEPPVRLASRHAALPPAPAPARLARLLAPELASGAVSVTESADRSVITLRGDGGFAPGSDEIAPRLLPALRRVGEALATVPGNVVVIGHTDDTRPALSARLPSNFDLSKARARNVAALLARQAGAAERFASEGRGETEPVAPNDSPANRARNRRVDIVVVAPVQPR
ncbi:type IVB secretion system protein IcmH/DotU [Pseudoduganella umbonata]|uniref:Type VI secretion system protein ImpK n=1 Tax=Pseudoduganella umbonata TaxID=864828 RepID=A0A4V1EDA6_9BURK|nr:type IVB secretion system protein IcmH/DotU [Pseudoduganella umbonata]MBB3221226.1 type VI secretion system protein ImpK [Pseudoduganella umbonata]QCP10411.1 type VI secretion system protein TssL [Pseudoduganella umbonata]